MSIELMSEVWMLQLSHPEQSILLCLADHADDVGENCFPSIMRIAWKTGYSKRQVIRILDRLEAGGIIERKRPSPGALDQYGEYLSTRYEIHLDRGVKKSPLKRRRRGANSHQSVVTKSKSRGDIATSHKPPEETPIKPPNGLDPKVWSRWVDYRRKIRKPIKLPSIPAAQCKLASFGRDQMTVVEQSIANGWTGLFPLPNSLDRGGRRTFDEMHAEMSRSIAESDDEQPGR